MRESQRRMRPRDRASRRWITASVNTNTGCQVGSTLPVRYKLSGGLKFVARHAGKGQVRAAYLLRRSS
jgi:hypothetical protein